VNLNKEQIEAIATRTGAYCVMATAGSGKTTVLTERVRQLFDEGISQDDILALTFTKEAANNMLKRLSLEADKNLRGGFRTFHSFCLNLVKREARFLPYGLSAEPFPDGQVLYKMILTAMKENGVRRKQYDEVKAAISSWKRHRITPEEAIDDPLNDPMFANVFEKYETMLHDGGMLDFDDMIARAVDILEQSEEARDRWQFKYVHCDESQDTDDLQFRLLQLISEKHGNVFCVGDFCQALYGFRGANPENLLEFTKWFPNAKTIILPENFRSTYEVVEFSKKNAPIENELTKNIRTGNASGPAIEFRMYTGSNEEAESVLSAAAQDPANSAILARTNDQLGIYESLAMQHNVKFQLLGRSGLWTKPEINMLVGLAAFCLGNQPAEKYNQRLIEPYRRAIRSATPEKGLNMVMEYGRLNELYGDQDYSDDENFALTNLKTVIGISRKFTSLGEFLNHARKCSHASRKSKNALTLSTIHQAKGLEWSNVFVIGVEPGLLPHKRGEIEEEKRIWYVAITRPKQKLRVSFSGSPSSFVEPHLTQEIREQLRKGSEQVEKLQRQMVMFQ